MTDAQIFQFFGLLYLAVGTGFLLNRGYLQKMISSFRENQALLITSAALALALGFVLITFHNVWQWQWSVLITIIGWLSLIKGLFILILPGLFERLMIWYANFVSRFRFFAVIIIILGAFFAYLGWFAV